MNNTLTGLHGVYNSLMGAEIYKGLVTRGNVANMPDWLHDLNWDAYFSRYPLRESKSPIFANEARIIDHVAGPILKEILSFSENVESGRNGIVMTIAHRGKEYTSPVAILYGKVDPNDIGYGEKIVKYTNYALFKTHFLIQHPELLGSLENLKLKDQEKWKIADVDLPGGAFAFKNGVIIGISGLSGGDKNTSAALTVGIAARLIREQKAVTIARRIGARDFVLNRLKYMALIKK